MKLTLRSLRDEMKVTLRSLRDEMKVTLGSLRDEMRDSIGEVHDRIDRTNLRLDEHISESAQRFDQVDARFDSFRKAILQDIKNEIVPELKRDISQNVVRQMVEALSPYFGYMEKRVDDHEKRVCALETQSQ